MSNEEPMIENADAAGCAILEQDECFVADTPEVGIRPLRYRLRLAFLLAWTLLAYGLWIASWPLGWATGREIRPIRRACLKLWGAGSLKIVGAKLVVRGKAPAPPFFLVSNHLSYVDIMVLAQQTGTSFVARADMADWPVMGWMMKKCHMLFIKREDLRDTRRVIGMIESIYAKGDAFTVFAEGRCGRGKRVHDFRPSLFQAPAQNGFPVHCAALSYETPPGEPAAGDSVVWWRWEPVGDHLRRMLSLPGYTATISYADEPILSGDRKVLAREAHAAITSLYSPVKLGILEEECPPEGLPKYLYEQ